MMQSFFERKIMQHFQNLVYHNKYGKHFLCAFSFLNKVHGFRYITKMNFFNITISMNGKEMELKISEDRQKEVRRQLCTMAAGKAVIE